MSRSRMYWIWVILLIPVAYCLWFVAVRLIPRPEPKAEQAPVEDRPAAPEPPRPDYTPIDEAALRNFESGTDYTISGRVISELSEPLPGAVVSAYATAPRWSPPAFEPPPALATGTTDDDGRYQIRLPVPANLFLGISKEGYASISVLIPVRDETTAVRDFRLQPAQTSIVGIVYDRDQRPVQGALVVANPPPFVAIADSPAVVPAGCTTDAAGKFSFEALAEGDVSLYCAAKGYVPQENLVPLRIGKVEQIDFTLPQGQLLSIAVQNARREGIPHAAAAAPGVFRIAGADSRGVVECFVPPGSSPFDCLFAAQGYKTSTVHLDPSSLPAAVTLADPDVLRGRVLTEAGRPVAGARATVLGTGGAQGKFDGAVETDRAGRFSLPLSFPPARELRVSRTGYFDQRIPFESGKPLPAEVAVRLRPVLTGIYGRVIDYRGINVKRFVVHLRSTAGGTPDTDYQKSFNSDKGAFVVTDVPPGTYTLLIQSVQSLPTDDVQLFRLEGVELRKGFLFGELQAQFPKPPFAK